MRDDAVCRNDAARAFQPSLGGHRRRTVSSTVAVDFQRSHQEHLDRLEENAQRRARTARRGRGRHRPCGGGCPSAGDPVEVSRGRREDSCEHALRRAEDFREQRTWVYERGDGVRSEVAQPDVPPKDGRPRIEPGVQDHGAARCAERRHTRGAERRARRGPRRREHDRCGRRRRRSSRRSLRR